VLKIAYRTLSIEQVEALTYCSGPYEVTYLTESFKSFLAAYREALHDEWEKERGHVVITTSIEGEPVTVTLQDDEGRVLKLLWERPTESRGEIEAKVREECAQICESFAAAEYKTGKVDHNEIGWTSYCAQQIRNGRASVEDLGQNKIKKLRNLLIECRSSVKADLNAYERLLVVKQKLNEQETPTYITADMEARRLLVLLEEIDAL
jgi:uncharacterized protein YlxW (UPF0749 family)